MPQGVGYQGVATDNGIELVNQSITLASILSGSSNGIVQCKETHQTQTDTFGLFSITIGQGVSTTNGIQLTCRYFTGQISTFKNRDGCKWRSQLFIGTNQMMSVPYAI